MFRVGFLGSRVQGSGCRVQGLGREVQGSRCRVQNVGFRVRVWGSGFRVYASGCGPWVWGVGFVVQSIKLCSITSIVFGRTCPSTVVATSFRDIAESGVMSTLPTHNIRLDMLSTA